MSMTTESTERQEEAITLEPQPIKELRNQFPTSPLTTYHEG